MPPPVFHDWERLPASYANFYIANAAVLMPAYDPERDAIARGVLGALFPTREIVPINSLDLVWGLGSVHCVTQQWPALPR
jgi:agmatine deiminase